jgi:hypothetical protein
VAQTKLAAEALPFAWWGPVVIEIAESKAPLGRAWGNATDAWFGKRASAKAAGALLVLGGDCGGGRDRGFLGRGRSGPGRFAAPACLRRQAFGVRQIGTYTNTIEVSGAVITIKTAAHFLVKALGVGLHREDAERVEQWQGNRLVFFHGVTVKNGDTTEIKGQAQGNNFVITSPLGTINAPASVKPANPWSSRSLDSTMMMRVDNGKVEPVRISGGNETSVTVDGASTTAKEYKITGSTNYKIWIDSHDVPVMFVVDDDSGEVTFSLKK